MCRLKLKSEISLFNFEALIERLIEIDLRGNSKELILKITGL